MRRPLPTLLLAGAAVAALALGPVPSAVTDVTDAVATSAPIDAEVLAAGDAASALLHVADGVGLDVLSGAAADLGLQVGSGFDRIGVLHVVGTVEALRTLAATGLVTWVEHDAPVTHFTDSSHEATRGQELLDDKVTLSNGTTIDGSGIGVAVVDSGIDDTHPDLDNVARNVKALPFASGSAIALPASDVVSLGGHGTHVAGTVAGSGSASDGRFHGAAPGATLYGVSAGTLISIHSGLEALNWVLNNHDQVEPAIRVVNNSWGSNGNGSARPDSALGRMIDALVTDGVVVVWAAGNSGGDGSAATTSPTCVQATPGNICVAAYDDLDSGSRNGPIASFSSRGTDGQPATYPDLAAPGASIVAACRPVMPICATGFNGSPLYATLSGTSMAAPHVAGIVAQVLQADPTLTPAQVEDLLEDTAGPIGTQGALIGDPTNANSDTSFDAGHGLVDARAAVEALLGGGA